MSFLKFVPPVIAHRGASGYAPENTHTAFIKAIQLGCTWIEFDIVTTLDNQLMVFHDEILDRTTNGKGLVNTHSEMFLKTLDVGSWFSTAFAGEKMLGLSSVVNLITEYQINANLEIKTYPGQEKKIIAQLINHLPTEFFTLASPILFSSFSLATLELLREAAPQSKIALLLHEWVDDWEIIFEKLNCSSLNVNEAILEQHGVKQIKQSGKIILAYTVNDPERARNLFDWGVNAVFSDYPDKIINVWKKTEDFASRQIGL